MDRPLCSSQNDERGSSRFVRSVQKTLGSSTRWGYGDTAINSETVQKPLSSGKRPWPLLWKALVIVVALVCILALYVVVFTQPIAKIQLALHNAGSSYSVRVGIYLDGKLKEIVKIDVSDYVQVYKLARGTHTIGFDYSYISAPDGVIDLQYSFDLTIFNPLTLSYQLSPW